MISPLKSDCIGVWQSLACLFLIRSGNICEQRPKSVSQGVEEPCVWPHGWLMCDRNEIWWERLVLGHVDSGSPGYVLAKPRRPNIWACQQRQRWVPPPSPPSQDVDLCLSSAHRSVRLTWWSSWPVPTRGSRKGYWREPSSRGGPTTIWRPHRGDSCTSSRTPRAWLNTSRKRGSSQR